MGKLAIKRLTASDLTIFKWQFDNSPSNQKSINLNADVFIEALYPTLTSTDAGRTGRLPIDLYLYGPGNARAWNLQRKIIKGDSYKNWRLNGEYISNPDDTPERFNALVAGDFVIFEFEGDLIPTAAKAVFVSANVEEDLRLHAGIRDSSGSRMRAIELAELHLIAIASGTPESHPVYELLLDASIEDAAFGGLEGTKRLLRRKTGHRLTRAALERARKRADDVGRLGEELINAHFAESVSCGTLETYDWIANDNAISPYDFTIVQPNESQRKVEVKSTTGDFNQILHISISQLIEMQESIESFDLYRVYKIDDHRASLRIKHDMREFGRTVLKAFETLPVGISVDSISVRPESIGFDEELSVEIPQAVEDSDP